ncbi:acyl-CoA dehydrogenase [Pseudomonas sp. Leaf48]|uniref:hypothetical protein n=1 Tax=Pseudomonas sp. Leaf48 TaxID=1736221 RepID=UPI00072A9F14|nr:hypothetical protein [Pseudomonas sp. Leaf48]KQN48726.1 acyl-CoA dehydrogenase [Pseudomonas sp. Leaf48]
MSNSATLEQLLEPFASRPVARTAAGDLQRLMQKLIVHGFSHLPLPGHGQTLERWRTLAAVAACDLALAKVFEGHTDALAIMAELEPDATPVPGSWGIWAAEPPFARVKIIGREGDQLYLQGKKAWCSGAPLLDHALVTVWDEQHQPQLVAVALSQPAISMSEEGWQAVGMASSASLDVHFELALARGVGMPGQYLDRPGFWQGGAGIAACWFGAACALAGYLRQHCTKPHHDVHAQAHLGTVDATLGAAAAALRETAQWIDAHPRDSAELQVRRVRAQVEAAVSVVLEHVGRALGATPYCRDSHFARLAADLPVYVRQSHAEKDLAELGKQVAAQPVGEWLL